jgi:hypothetical protein
MEHWTSFQFRRFLNWFPLGLTYGLAVAINGPLADRFDGRRAILSQCAEITWTVRPTTA